MAPGSVVCNWLGYKWLSGTKELSGSARKRCSNHYDVNSDNIWIGDEVKKTSLVGSYICTNTLWQTTQQYNIYA